MTSPFGWELPEHMVETLQARLAEGQDNADRRASLASLAADMPGPLGALLRAVAHSYAGWLDADTSGHATQSEGCRVEHVTDAAVAVATWLGGGE